MADVFYHLKLDGIEGESTDDKHKGEIELLAFSIGVNQTGSGGAGGGGGTGKAQFHDFQVTKNVDASSPKLFLAGANHQHIKSGVLTCSKGGGGAQDYLVYKFSNLTVNFFHKAGTPGKLVPMETIKFGYEQVEVEYKPQKDDGSLGGGIKAGWHLGKHAKV
jgi:type VI secretion system secreted protein Hcp